MNNYTSNVAEDIAYMVCILMQSGWIRISKYDCNEYITTHQKYGFDINHSFLWLKKGKKQLINIPDDNSFLFSNQIEVSFFTLEEAFYKETENQNNK